MRLDSPNESLAWRAYCAAVGMLDLAWPRRRLREESLAGMATMRERLRILPEAR